MIVGIISFYIRAARWRLLMLPLGGIRRRDAFDGVNVGYITNFAIPRAGEIARCGVVSKKSKIPFESVVGTVFLERSFDMLTLAIVSIITFAITWNQFGFFFDNFILSSISEKLSVNLIWVLLILLTSFLIFAYIIYRYRKTHPFLIKIVQVLKGLLKGIIAGFKMPQKWLFILYTILLWGSFWLTSVTTILAFQSVDASVASLNLTDALFLMIVGSFGWVIPVQGGIGAYHFIVTLALSSVYGISQTTGIVFATISHESQALVMILVGLYSLSRISLSQKKNFVK